MEDEYFDQYKIYKVEGDGKTLKLKPGQLKISVLAKLFHLFPESIILISEDGCVETPDDNGDFLEVNDFHTWSATGESTKPSNVATASNSPLVYSYQLPGKKGGGKWTPRFTSSMLTQRQKPPGVRAQEQLAGSSGAGAAGPSQSEPEWRKYVEVCKWSERDGGWKKVSNLPVSLTETTANIERVAQMVSEDALAGEPGVVLDNEYLRLLDAPSTRGKFPILVVKLSPSPIGCPHSPLRTPHPPSPQKRERTGSLLHRASNKKAVQTI